MNTEENTSVSKRKRDELYDQDDVSDSESQSNSEQHSDVGSSDEVEKNNAEQFDDSENKRIINDKIAVNKGLGREQIKIKRMQE